VLFILIRRPYEIGDGIHVSDVNIQTPNVGSDCWVVKDVSLFATTVVFVRTKEVATMSNGSLASSRIINSSRSHHASLYCLIKFPISVQYNKLKVFQDALQTYIRNRPREWLGFTTFRVNRVVTEEGFIEYMFVGTHRESWYHLGTLRDSLGSLLSFTVELSKKLDITYQKPAMPVNMSMVSTPHFPAAMPSLALSSSGEEPILSPRSRAGSMDYSTDLRGLHDLFAPAREFKHGHGKEHS
jgi:Mechanosensitive ion channel